MSDIPALPPHLAILRGHVGAVANAIDEFARLTIREAWGVDAPSTKRDRALDTINARMVQACDHIGIMAREKQLLVTLISAQREELAVRAQTIDDLQRRTTP
jgi:hypothetical protein